MRRLALLCIVTVTLLQGCANTPKRVDLKTLPTSSYIDLKDRLGYDSLIDLGNWKHIEVSALLLHKEILYYHSEAPEYGTGVEFFVRDPYGEFLIANYELIIDTGGGNVTSVLGLGTSHPVVRGAMAGMHDGIRIVPVEGAVGTKVKGVKRFILVLPIDITQGCDRLFIHGTEIYDTDRHFEALWDFTTAG